MKPIIKVENVSKQYRLGAIGTGTIRDDVQRWWHRVRGKEDPFLKVGDTNDRSTKANSDYVWALKDINFEVMPGEVLGIIGKNGAGKSTLLKILSKVTGPTTGRIDFNGRIGSLLEVGTGFHPDLTGRENIFLNGAILGMTKREIRSKLDEIIDFSGCERYIDTPVKRYSSGMTVRLGFAVAAHLDPEILIIDEVLAVGDDEFQKKAIGKMQEVSRNEGRTVLFVSHSMGAVKALCNRIVIISNGTVGFVGNVDESINKYLENQDRNRGNVWMRNKRSGKLKNSKLSILRVEQSLTNRILSLDIDYVSNDMHKDAFVAVDIVNQQGVALMQALPTLRKLIPYSAQTNRFFITIDLPKLIPGEYFTNIWIGSHNTETLDWVEFATSFTIYSSPTEGRTFPHTADHGYIVPDSKLIVHQSSPQIVS
ncbi:polysaccharide ABC transporter ATP-binding protein [Spirosoma oryzicola]|uniref:ABC transporter ATP-binding protein n=1 Tax=Spirosoma oryzicola TaxID=2898794 RepID=UPI001E59D74A|nr:polysaccharide ABC transporter ATP-binding protein [Spirosoma oryzicola]UHG94047.1 polysaccharide ABC transporter ATP-binding protein [Spirosoma oryzicola]